MQTQETEKYVSLSEQYNPYASVENLEPPATQEIPEQGTSRPPHNPSEPPGPPEPLGTPPAPPKRPHHGRNIILITLLLASMAGGGLFIGWQFSGKGSPGTTATATPSQSSATVTQSQREAAIAKVAAAVVELKVTTAEGQQIGSGVIIDANGNIVTNNHVVSGAQTIEVVLSNGKTEQAQLIGTNASTDLAVVRIQPFDGMTVAKIGDSSKLVVGQTVLAIGSPLGLNGTVTEGIVSTLNQNITESKDVKISHAIQTSAALNPGNSGGALINLQGELVGIPTVTAIDTESNTAANGIGFAIPSNVVTTVLQQIIQQ